MSLFSSIEFHDLVLAASESLRPLPRTVTELASVAADEDSTLDDLVSLVQPDVFLTTALLREANSAASASVEEIVEVSRAVVRLGRARVVAVAVGSCLADVGDDNLDGYGIDRDQFWQDARACSLVAEAVVREMTTPVGPAAVTASLLQNLGKLVLAPHLRPEHLEPALETHRDEVLAERELIDLDHAQVGAMLAELWSLPSSIVEGIRGHHLVDGGESDIARVVHVAEATARAVGGCSGGPDGQSLADLRFVDSLEVLGVQLDPLLTKARARLGLDDD